MDMSMCMNSEEIQVREKGIIRIADENKDGLDRLLHTLDTILSVIRGERPEAPTELTGSRSFRREMEEQGGMIQSGCELAEEILNELTGD